MGATLIGFALGLVVGAATGTEGGAFGGAMLGMSIGLVVFGVQWMRAHLGDEPVVERHLVMCTPYGQVAEAEFVGDLGTKRWGDVTRCSLLRDPDHVDCDKGCVALMNLAHVRPGKACACEHASAAEQASR
jgi:hypothetical protein